MKDGGYHVNRRVMDVTNKTSGGSGGSPTLQVDGVEEYTGSIIGRQ